MSEVDPVVDSGVDSDLRVAPDMARSAPNFARWPTVVSLPHSRLSPRDLAVIQTVVAFNQATSSQLLRLHFSEPYTSPRSRRQRTCRALKRLVEWNQLSRIGRAVGGSYGGSSDFVYLPPDSRARMPNPHTLDITELYVQLVESGTRLLAFDPEPFSHDHYGNTEVKPDAKIRVQTPNGIHQWYIEVDRGTEFGPQLSAKMRRYISAWRQRDKSFFPLVLFLVHDDSRRRFVRSIVRRQEVAEMFRVILFEEVIETLSQ